jgi:hypothetical protein
VPPKKTKTTHAKAYATKTMLLLVGQVSTCPVLVLVPPKKSEQVETCATGCGGMHPFDLACARMLS